jgi:hypothetical protein
MPTLIYCTYLTVYTGNKLPPFYIGSTSVDNVINKGYSGSVVSKTYMAIWKQELSDHPDLFKTIILTRHETREEAMERELIFQEAFSVARNPLYINMAHANGKFFTSGPLAPEHKAKIGAAKKGQKRSPETKAKMSAAKTGKKREPFSPEHKANISAAQIGKKLGARSPETKAKISAAMTGKKRGPQSPETIAKKSAARTGKKHTPETKAKMAATKTGKKQSPETIAKRVAARIGKKRGPNKKK